MECIIIFSSWIGNVIWRLRKKCYEEKVNREFSTNYGDGKSCKITKWLIGIIKHFIELSIKLLRKNKYMDVFFISIETFSAGNVLKRYPIKSMKEYCKINNKNFYRVVEEEKERIVCVAEYWGKTSKEIKNYLSKETYVTQINDAIIFGATNIVLSGGYFLNDLISDDNQERIDLRDGVLRKVVDEDAFLSEPKEMNICEKAISIIGGATYNYYHLLIEILPKLVIIDRFEEYRHTPILVDGVVLNIPQFRRVLDVVNVFGHPVIVVKNHEKWWVKNLIYVSNHSWMPINLYRRDLLFAHDFMIAENYLYGLRDRILENIYLDDEKDEKQKYFISRKNTNNLRLRNEQEIRNVFEMNGYEIIYPEELTFEEQISCFRNAESVVAASGAALTNIIFCQPGTKIICLIPREFKFHMYSTIAHLFELEPIFLDCKIIDKTLWTALDSYVLDEDYAKEFINQMKGN